MTYCHVLPDSSVEATARDKIERHDRSKLSAYDAFSQFGLVVAQGYKLVIVR